MDGFITQIVGPIAMTSRKRDEQRKRETKKYEHTEKKEGQQATPEQYGAIYIHGESEMTPITYKRPKSH